MTAADRNHTADALTEVADYHVTECVDMHGDQGEDGPGPDCCFHARAAYTVGDAARLLRTPDTPTDSDAAARARRLLDAATPGPEWDTSRFWSKVDMTPTIHGCWVWTAGVAAKGYGQFRLNGKMEKAHRVAYELSVGPIPEGLVIDHLCRNRACVNSDHLETVTAVENTRRGDTWKLNAAKTRCPQGHPYDEANTYISRDGWRGCRICRRDQTRAYRARGSA